jgi:hypothetical protein
MVTATRCGTEGTGRSCLTGAYSELYATKKYADSTKTKRSDWKARGRPYTVWANRISTNRRIKLCQVICMEKKWLRKKAQQRKKLGVKRNNG